jgi:polyhydroxybutyrate depolymerase
VVAGVCLALAFAVAMARVHRRHPGLERGLVQPPGASASPAEPPNGRPGTDVLRSAKVGARARAYHAHLPPAVAEGRPLPLVLNLHGFNSNAEQEAGLSRMNATADREGFIVLYPEGTGWAQSWNAGICCGEALTKQVDDVAYIRAVLDEEARHEPVDPKRVYATGMSNGGFLSHRLACELSDRIAAIAPVAGLLGVGTCQPTRPVSVLQFAGTADALVKYEGGGMALFPKVEDVMAGWAQRDGCQSHRAVSYQKGDVTCERYTGCPAGVDVELCKVQGGGHTWPGGTPVPMLGHTTGDVSATERMWQFFREHPM